MTGFGRASVASSEKKFTIEIKSLNSKQLDLSVRMPSAFREVEVGIRSELSSVLQRGKVELNATVENISDVSSLELNIPVLKEYKQQILQLASMLDIPTPADWYATLLRLPDVLKSQKEETTSEEAQNEQLREAVKEAVEALVEFRKREGAKLEKFFREKIEVITELLKRIEPFEKERIIKIRQRLEDQLLKLDTPEYDRDRLEQELIFYIEKLDVTEEKIRLSAHLDYFLATLSLPEGGQGKKLGFIAQEMGREINTLGSKSNHAEMQKIVVLMKDELEQIKEQVLNVL